MRRWIVLAVLLLGAAAWGQYEKFDPVEPDELHTVLKAHEGDGPGTDFYGPLLLRIHLKVPVQPTAIDFAEGSLASVLRDTGSRFGPQDFAEQFVFAFPSNAPWHKEDAHVAFYINKELKREWDLEVGTANEVWLFVVIRQYSTFSMMGYGRVMDFLTAESMKRKGLLP